MKYNFHNSSFIIIQEVFMTGKVKIYGKAG